MNAPKPAKISSKEKKNKQKPLKKDKKDLKKKKFKEDKKEKPFSTDKTKSSLPSANTMKEWANSWKEPSKNCKKIWQKS